MSLIRESGCIVPVNLPGHALVVAVVLRVAGAGSGLGVGVAVRGLALFAARPLLGPVL